MIHCKTTGKKYYGSTKLKLSRRISLHKNSNATCGSREIMENDNYEVFALFVLKSKKLSRILEDILIETNECVNRIKAYRSKQYLINYHKKYNKENSVLTKYFSSFNCECGGKYNKYNKEKHYDTIKHKIYEYNLLFII